MNRNELAVFGVILTHGPISNQEIADVLDWPINRVTGRTFDLRDKGLVTESHRDFYNSNVRVIHWQKVPLRSIVSKRLKKLLPLRVAK